MEEMRDPSERRAGSSLLHISHQMAVGGVVSPGRCEIIDAQIERDLQLSKSRSKAWKPSKASQSRVKAKIAKLKQKGEQLLGKIKER
jgi:hypothetical protein